ncbi:MAG TPA: glycosyltransferase family 39 protein, partial [Sedimentisphaerales bacterium]|nr:glycosyltransferase family 39 protein [Sedimentisphaerales bacterium]
MKAQTGFLILFICFALVLGAGLVFQQVRDFDFVNYDDNEYVYENQHVLKGLTYEGVIWAFRSCDIGYWQPLTWLSLMLDCQLFGPNAGGIHLVNVLLHLANTLLLFAVLKKITGSLWPSAFVAAAFAIHPMHVESVAWIAERKDVLSTFFFLLTLAAYAGYVKRPSVLRYFAAIVLFALGLMSKPMLVTLPFVLLLLDYWPLNRLEVPKIFGGHTRKPEPAADRRSTLYRIIIEKIPFVALSAVSSVITFIVQRSIGAMNYTYILSLESRFANALLSYVRYMGKMFWPENLAVFYPFGDVGGIFLGRFALYALLPAGITFLVLRFGRTRKYLPV